MELQPIKHKNKEELKEELKEILSANENLVERMKDEQWNIFYNKRADMVTMGHEFPVGTFYYPIEDGVMLRIDKGNIVYGIAIENASFFIKKHPDIGFGLSLIMYPSKRFILFVILVFLYHTINVLKVLRNMLPERMSDYIAGRASWAC